jgi:phage terminase large subunit
MTFDLRKTTNPKFMPAILECHDRYMGLVGGAGSGKSHSIAQKMLLRIRKAMNQGYREKFLGLRKTQPAVRRSVFALFMEYIILWDMMSFTKVNRSDLSFTFPGSNQILCMGLDDPEKLKSIEGVTSVWMEETTEFAEGDYVQVDLRLRGETPSYKQIAMSYNPVDRNSWLFHLFFDPEKTPREKEWDNGNSFKTKDATIIHSTWRDNRFIDDQYKEMLDTLKDKDEALWMIYDQGLWAVLKNLIYSNYARVKDSDWPDAFDDVWYGLDLGFTNPTALVECCSLDGQIYERELIYEPGLHTEDIIERLKELEISPSSNIYADPSSAKEIDLIHKAGYNIDKADNNVLSGIRHVRGTHVKIHEDSINHLNEKKAYKYKEDRNGSRLEEPVKFNDHAQDAERYGLFTHLTQESSDVWFL